MANTERSVFESLSPIFTVRDFAEALAFYTDALEFEIGWTWGDPPTYAANGAFVGMTVSTRAMKSADKKRWARGLP